MSSILFVTSEMSPFCSSGGLGEVSRSLPIALAQKGNDVTVVLPRYASIDLGSLSYVETFAVRLAWRYIECGLYQTMCHGVRVLFLDAPAYFDRYALYGHYDDGERFAFFCAAVMALIPRLAVKPDILHLNDWQSALCLPYLHLLRSQFDAYAGIKTVYTIHNITYRGIYSPAILGDVFGLSDLEGSALYWGDTLNFTAGAIRLCDRLTTVSPTYAGQIRDEHISDTLAPLIREHSYKLSGIVNGIDTIHYSPEREGEGIFAFSISDMRGKDLTKAALLRDLDMDEDLDRPLVSMVSRLVPEKGTDLIAEVFERLMERGARVIIHGSGEGGAQAFFSAMERVYPRRVRAVIGYDPHLARRIYAGSDFLLMPSRTEPCGVSQRIAALCGTLPIVHLTGGLSDTVSPYNAYDGTGDGFGFWPFDEKSFLAVYDLAMTVYYDDKEALLRLRKSAMQKDHSWNASALAYEAIYEALISEK